MKRFFAMIGIILLAGLYISTLVFALINSPLAHELFKLSIIATIIIPALIYSYILVYKYIGKGRNQNNEETKQ